MKDGVVKHRRQREANLRSDFFETFWGALSIPYRCELVVVEVKVPPEGENT